MSRALLLPLALLAVCYLPVQESDAQLLRRKCREGRPLICRPLLARRSHCVEVYQGGPPGQSPYVYCPTKYLYVMGDMYWYEHSYCPNQSEKSYDCYPNTVTLGCETNNTSCKCGNCRNMPIAVGFVDKSNSATPQTGVTLTYGDSGDTVANQRAIKVVDQLGNTSYFRVVKAEYSGSADPLYFAQPTMDVGYHATASAATQSAIQPDDGQLNVIVFEAVINGEGSDPVSIWVIGAGMMTP